MTEAQPTFFEEARKVLGLLFENRGAAWERVRRGIGVLRARIALRRCVILGKRINVLGRVRVIAGGRIEIGERVQFWEGTIAQELVCAEGARIHIGGSTVFNYGVSLRATTSIEIGPRCMFGSLVLVHDENRVKKAPIVIGSDVWIAHGAIIAPGVTIGEGSVVGAGSVVVDDVPPFSLAAGNPARSTPLTDADRNLTPRPS